jgi:hypothetical protein
MPLTNLQMKQQASFVNWDFRASAEGSGDYWVIDEGFGYPRLNSQRSTTVAVRLTSKWMYQNLANQTASRISAEIISIDDPFGNSGYERYWSFRLPDDVSAGLLTVSGGGRNDLEGTFAAPSCDDSNGLSDSGQVFDVVVEVVGRDHGNYGIAEGQFAIALLGDVNNDGTVNIVDRAIVNAFWRTGAAGAFSLRDCDLNADGVVNVVDRSIANAIFRGNLGQNEVSEPCAFR